MTATDSDREALLRAVRADPADDLPRLAFADWLEENGDQVDYARAELIRVQLRLDRPTGVIADTGRIVTWRELTFSEVDRRRESRLFNEAAHWWGWLADLYPLLETHAIADLSRCSDGATHGVRFRRGFVEEVRAPLQALVDHGAEVLRRHPVTRMVAAGRAPEHNAAGWCWRWVRDEEWTGRQSESPAVVPESVWELTKFFDRESEAAAINVLSAALIRLATRRLEGGG